MRRIESKNISRSVVLKKMCSEQRITLLGDGDEQVLKQSSFANRFVHAWNYIGTAVETTTGDSGEVEATNLR